MAVYACAVATHQTAGTAVDEIDLAADFSYVEVIARANPVTSAQAPIYFCVDDERGPNGDGIPTIGGVDTYVVTTGVGAKARARSKKTTSTKVKVITSSGQPYSVVGVND